MESKELEVLAFVRMDCKGVTGVPCVRMESKGVRGWVEGDRARSRVWILMHPHWPNRHSPKTPLYIDDNDTLVVIGCQGEGRGLEAEAKKGT
jgi:hypothetical protein